MSSHKEKAQQAAERVVDKPGVLKRVLKRSSKRLSASAGRLGNSKKDFSRALRLSKAWAKGEYTQIPKASLVALVGALIYFLMPLDAIPDPILGLGFLDDIAVLGYAMRYARKDLETFEQWEQSRDA